MSNKSESMDKYRPPEVEKVEKELMPEPGKYRVLDVTTFFMGDSAVTLNPDSWFTLERASKDQYLLIIENGPSTVEIYLSPKNIQRAGIKVEKVD
jgi:hypothetical protein